MGLGLICTNKHGEIKLSNIKLTINYDTILRIETNIAEAVIKKMEENDGV